MRCAHPLSIYICAGGVEVGASGTPTRLPSGHTPCAYALGVVVRQSWVLLSCGAPGCGPVAAFALSCV
jgi:hypothetical protein